MKAEAPYIHLLRRLLMERLRHRWAARFYALGPALDQVESRNALYEHVRDEINDTNTAELGPRLAERVSISKDTVRRLLTLDEAEEIRGFYGPTKEALSHYLGYKGWDDFRARHAELRDGTN